jgi:6-phosphogluconate dehydrogenase
MHKLNVLYYSKIGAYLQGFTQVYAKKEYIYYYLNSDCSF